MLGAMEQRIMQLITAQATHRNISEQEAAVQQIDELHQLIAAHEFGVDLLDSCDTSPLLRECLRHAILKP